MGSIDCVSPPMEPCPSKTMLAQGR
jgi:hypothetical protein